jgi:hypothetical protein
MQQRAALISYLLFQIVMDQLRQASSSQLPHKDTRALSLKSNFNAIRDCSPSAS